MKRNLVLATLAVAAGAQAADYKLTITNLGGQPLSPLFYSASTSAFDIFTLGSSASLGIKKIAEGGDTSAMLAIAAGAGSAVGTYGVLGGSPLGTGLTRSLVFSADAAHSYFSFAAMLGKTNDGFIGEGVSSAGFQLGGGDLDLIILGTRAWDAGTELNTQNAADLGFLGGAGNPQEAPADAHVRTHAGIVPNFGDSWDQMPAWASTSQIAHITVQSVPEPASLAALAMGGLALLRRRGRRI